MMTETKQGSILSASKPNSARPRRRCRSLRKGPRGAPPSDVGASFERAGERIARALGRAASDGEGSFKRLAKVVLEEFAKIALERIFTQGGSQTSFFGAKAAGGAVNAGGAYLVGERGPEMFVPRQAGAIVAQAGAGPVSVHFHLSGGADATPSPATRARSPPRWRARSLTGDAICERFS